MSGEELDLSGLVTWEDGLPRPQWELIEAWIKFSHEPQARRDAWVEVSRQWLTKLGPALGVGYEAIESDNFLALVPREGEAGSRVLKFAERSRVALLSALGGVATFDCQGKQILIVPRDPDHYYRYISLYFPDGEYGGSGGLHISEGLPHIVLSNHQYWAMEIVLAHELTHAALHHLHMPQWLEEGLAQIFEHSIAGRQPLQVDGELAGRHKRYWSKHGLDEFWRGEGFLRPGKVQELTYQLAEILVRLLVEESRPRWFGWVREPQSRFLALLRDASASDYGEAACQKHLRYGLMELAARFLGPGAWLLKGQGA